MDQPHSRSSWLLLTLLVVGGGLSIGAFWTEWVRTDANQDWLTPYLPTMAAGVLITLAVWLGLALWATWMNCTFFPSALWRVGWRLLLLILYAPLCLLLRAWDWNIWSLLVLLPVGLSLFWSYSVALTLHQFSSPSPRPPAEESHKKIGIIPLILVWLFALSRFWDWYEISLLRHHNFHSNGYDLGLMSHIMNRLVSGEGLTSSLIVAGGSFLGHHFSPILYFIAPFFFLHPHPETLLFLQAAAVALAAIPLFLVARVWLGSDWAALAIALIYLNLPGLSEGVLADYHVITFAPILFFWLAYEATRSSNHRFWVPLVLLVAVQENLFLYSLSLGIFLSFSRITRFRGLVIAGGSLVAAILIIGFLMPLFRVEGQPEFGFPRRYVDFIPMEDAASKGSLSSLIGSILGNPGTAVSLLFSGDRPETYQTFWGGVFFTPLLNPLGWILLVPCLETSLSSDPTLHQWTGHYGIAPAMVSALAVLAFFRVGIRWRFFKSWVTPLAWTLFFSAAFWGMRHSDLPYSVAMPDINYSQREVSEGASLALRRAIPTGHSIAAQSNLLPHLTHHDRIYLLPPGRPTTPGTTDSGPSEDFSQYEPDVGWPDYLVYDSAINANPAWYNLWFFPKERTLEWLDWLVKSGRYHPSHQTGTLIVLERAGSTE